MTIGKRVALSAIAAWSGAAILFAGGASAAQIEPYGRGTFAAIRQAHEGRPLVVHFWSVTCIPCLVEMPRLAEFARARTDFDLVFVSTDPIAQRARIVSRLEKFGLSDAPNYAFADAFEERLRFEADRTWRGELPFTVFVGADPRTHSVTGPVDPDQIDGWVRAMPSDRSRNPGAE